MAEVLGSAILELSTDSTKLEEGLRNAEGAANRGLGSLGKVALGIGAVGVTAAAGFGATMLKAGADVEAAFAEVRTLLPTIGDEAFGALQKDVLDLGAEMNVTTTESIPALYQAISAGVPAENVVDFLKIASKAATGGVTDLETAVDGITSVVNAYGTETISAQKASDLMFTAVRLGKTDFTQLSARLFNVIPIAASLGVGFDQVAAGLATMTAQGVPTAQATTQLRQLFTEASKTGTDLSATIKEKLGKSFGELVESGKPVHEILGEVRDGMPDQKFRDLFSSVEASNAALLITGPNAKAMSANLAEMQTSAGATDAAFETMAATAQFKVQRAINWVKTTVSDLGLRVLPILVNFVEKSVIPAFQKMVKWFNDNRATLLSFWTSFQAAMRRVSTWVKENIVPVVVGAFTAISTWVTNNKEGITAFFGAVKTAATTLVDYFRTSFGLIKTLLQTLFDLIAPQAVDTGGVGKFFTNLVSWATTAVDWYSEYLSGITDAIQGIIDWINENPDKIQAWFETARAAVEVAVGALSTIIGGVVKAVQAIVTWVQENPDTIQKWFDTAKAALEITIAAIETVIGWVVTAVQSVAAWINENPETISAWFNTAKGAVETVVDLIVGIIGGVVNAIAAIKTWIDENQEGITSFFTAIKDAAQGVADFFETGWGLVTTIISQLWNLGADEEGEPAIQRLFANIVEWGKGVVEWFGSEEGGAAISAFFTNIVKWATTAVNWFSENLGKITSSIAGITTFLAENPTAIQDWFNNAWETVNTVKDNMLTAVDNIVEKWGTISGFFEELWNTVGTTFNEKWALIKEFIIQPFVDAVGWLTENWAGVAQWFVDMWNNVGTAFAAAWQGITDLLFPEPSYAERLADVWGGIVDAIRGIFTDSANSAIAILNKLVDLMNTALRKWNELSFRIEGFSASVPWPSLKNPLRKKEIGWGGISISTPDIPLVATLPPFAVQGMAEGGIVQAVPGGILANIGEGGSDEAVIPLDSPQAARLGLGGGAMKVIQIENVYGFDDFREKVAEAGVDIQISGATNAFAGI